MGDPVVCQPVRPLQALDRSEQEALCDRGECIQVVLRQAVLRADTYCTRVGPARLQPLHKQRAAVSTLQPFHTESAQSLAVMWLQIL